MRFNQILTCVALIAAVTTTGAQTTLKLGHAQSSTSAFQVGAQAMADEFFKLTNGRYKITIFPSGALGGEREMVENALIRALTISRPRSLTGFFAIRSTASVRCRFLSIRTLNCPLYRLREGATGTPSPRFL